MPCDIVDDPQGRIYSESGLCLLINDIFEASVMRPASIRDVGCAPLESDRRVGRVIAARAEESPDSIGRGGG